MAEQISSDALRKICEASIARDSMLDFMKYTWQSNSPFIVGEHTSKITQRLDKAIEDYKAGKSSYLMVTLPFRHGKSDIISRHFPPYAFGKMPDVEIILATYAQELSNQMSRFARGLIKTTEFQEVFYKEQLELSSESSSVQNWEIAGHKGKFQAMGISGGATGKGADILIVDDYLKGRTDAESEVVRNGQWDNFTANLMTRLAPVHIVIILATPWHVDDIIGRIKNRMDKKHKDYNPEFPKFELMRFPAKHSKYPSGYLFPERFSPQWYQGHFATLGIYQSAALLQCEPTLRGGNMFKVEGINIVDEMPVNLRWVRYWDLASTEKERIKEDPDWTIGSKVAVTEDNGIYSLYIDDVQMCQAEAPERNAMIERTAEVDGPEIWQGVESVGGYKDSYTTLKKILSGKAIVYKGTVKGDKVVRAGAIEPIFDAGNIYMRRAPWNEAVKEQFQEFPACLHDDIVDSISGGYPMAVEKYKKAEQLGGQLGKGAI